MKSSVESSTSDTSFGVLRVNRRAINGDKAGKHDEMDVGTTGVDAGAEGTDDTVCRVEEARTVTTAPIGIAMKPRARKATVSIRSASHSHVVAESKNDAARTHAVSIVITALGGNVCKTWSGDAGATRLREDAIPSGTG